MYRWAVRVATGFLALIFIIGVFGYGVAVQRLRLPPYNQLAEIEAALRSIRQTITGEKPWYYIPAPIEQHETVLDSRPEPRQPGLNLVTGTTDDKQLITRIVDMSGATVHEWKIDWFELVPDDSYLPEADRPKSRPGTMIHGAVLMPNGDLVFNFETKALIRLDRDGNIVWRQHHLTHHSLEIGPNGYLWAPLLRQHTEETDPRFPGLEPPFNEAIVARIDPDDGRIVEQISVYDILIENGLRSLLYMPRGDPNNSPTGDIAHLNDVEVFYGSQEPGIFQPGDIMVSLRNINTVIVFDPVTRKIRHKWLAANFINQHDPDFIDSNRISIYDNNPIGAPSSAVQSRILVADVHKDLPEVWYAGTESGSESFYNFRMGKNQWLEDGHLLVTDTGSGRGFELDQDGNIVWEYYNLLADGQIGAVWEIQRLPEWAASLFPAR